MVVPENISKNAEWWNQNSISVATLNGGGTMGLLTVHMIAAFVDRSGKPFHESFDQVHGVSVGSLNAAAIWPLERDSRPLATPEELKTMYYASMDDVFSEGNWTSLWGTVGNKFDAEGIETLLKKTFGDTKLSDYKDGLNIHVFDLDTQQEVAFSSDEAKLDPSRDFYMRDLLRVATAAPTYFRQKTIQNLAGKDVELTDAGIYSSNPSFVTYMRLEDSGIDPENIVMTNFGTGVRKNEKVKASDLNDGIIGSGGTTIGSVFRGATNTHEQLLVRRMGHRFTVLDLDITGEDVTITSSMKDLAPYAERAVTENEGLMDKALYQIENTRDPYMRLTELSPNDHYTPVFTHLDLAG